MLDRPGDHSLVRSSFLHGCFVVEIGVNFPIAILGSGRNQPGLIAAFDPQQQLRRFSKQPTKVHSLRRFSKQPTKVHSRDAKLAKLGGGDRRDFVFLDGEIGCGSAAHFVLLDGEIGCGSAATRVRLLLSRSARVELQTRTLRLREKAEAAEAIGFHRR
jgi:hypothetical protein